MIFTFFYMKKYFFFQKRKKNWKYLPWRNGKKLLTVIKIFRAIFKRFTISYFWLFPRCDQAAGSQCGTNDYIYTKLYVWVCVTVCFSAYAYAYLCVGVHFCCRCRSRPTFHQKYTVTAHKYQHVYTHIHTCMPRNHTQMAGITRRCQSLAISLQGGFGGQGARRCVCMCVFVLCNLAMALLFLLLSTVIGVKNNCA